MPQNITGYMLVKDKDGQLKYFKDGKFYSLEEVQQLVEQASAAVDQTRKKVELKPVLTFQDKPKPTISIPITPGLPRIDVATSGSVVARVETQNLASPLPMSLPSFAPPTTPPPDPAPVSVPVAPKPISSMKLKPILMKPAVAVAPATVPSAPVASAASTVVETQNLASPLPMSPIPVPPVTPAKNKFDLESLEPDSDLGSRRQQDSSLVQVRVQEVLERLKIQFTDDQIKQRFVNVLTTYFRGIRGKAEVEYILTLSRAGGGLELPKEKAALIVSMLGQHSDETNRERRGIVSKPRQSETSETSKTSETSVQPPAPSHPVAQSPVPQPVPPKQMIKPEIVRPTELAQPVVQPKVGDVKMSSKLVGPIEELTYMTVADFRLLGRNIDETVNSLLEKIQLLSDESLGRKVQGIKAWKQSPVFLLYLGMSMQGIMQGQTMEQVIIDKQRNHADCLTLSEFEAISRLNSQLVY